MSLVGRDGGTSATVTTDVQLSGKVATMGQGVLQDVSRRLVETFAANLATMLERGERVPTRPTREEAAEPTPATEPRKHTQEEHAAPREPDSALDLGSLGGAVVADRLRNPRILTALLLIVALVAFLAGRRSKGG